MTSWNFSDIYRTVAEEVPNALALIQGERVLRWRELIRRTEALAATMVACGLRRQDKVAQYLFNCTEYLESAIASFQAGLVPLNTNYRYGADELEYLWTNGDVACVVFHGSFAPLITSMKHRVPGVRLWLWVDDNSGCCPDWAMPYEVAATLTPKASWRQWPPDGNDLLLLYTGGTTGLPKGVMWRQQDIFIRLSTENGETCPPDQDLDWLRTKISRHGRTHLSAAPLMHGAGLLTCFSTLARGGAVSHLTKRNFDPTDLLDTVDRDQVATVMWVGDAFARPVLHALESNPGRWNLKSLRTIISSGVVFSADVKQAILKHMPHVVIADVFGSSETMSLGRSVTQQGKPAQTATFKAKATTRVIDDHGRDVVPGSGQRGMLAIGGRQPVGYYNDPVKTAATFRIVDGERYVVPGDWATVDAAGVVHLIGRGSECINTGGEKVFPDEVEIALKTHSDVEDAVVVGVPDERFGQAVAAIVQRRANSLTSESDLIEHVKQRIAPYKAPRRIALSNSITRLPNGKADLAAARALLIEGVVTS